MFEKDAPLQTSQARVEWRSVHVPLQHRNPNESKENSKRKLEISTLTVQNGGVKHVKMIKGFSISFAPFSREEGEGKLKSNLSLDKYKWYDALCIDLRWDGGEVQHFYANSLDVLCTLERITTFPWNLHRHLCFHGETSTRLLHGELGENDKQLTIEW